MDSVGMAVGDEKAADWRLQYGGGTTSDDSDVRAMLKVGTIMSHDG